MITHLSHIENLAIVVTILPVKENHKAKNRKLDPKEFIQLTINNKWRCNMKFNDNEHNYIESDEERESGHEDTRHKNFECENKTNLGCNMGIDVAG